MDYEDYEHEKEPSEQLEKKNSEINRLKSEVEVLNITIKHLHEVLKEKTDTSMEQQREIINLNQRINQLSFENTQLKAQNSLLTGHSQLEGINLGIPQDFTRHLQSREESKEYDMSKDMEKMRLIEETENLLKRGNQRKPNISYGNSYDEMNSNIQINNVFERNPTFGNQGVPYNDDITSDTKESLIRDKINQSPIVIENEI